MNIMDLKVKQGDPVSHELWNGLVDLLGELLKGPSVVAPMEIFHGAIKLGQDYQVWVARTTSVIPARGLVAGVMTWGSNTASFLTVNAAGQEVTMPGFATFTAWNYFGAAIASGIRIEVSWTYDKWVICGGDCSGVA